MLIHICCAIIAATSPFSEGSPASPTGEKSPQIIVGDMTFSGNSILFKSDGRKKTCTLEGSAKMILGDIEITAETIQVDIDNKDATGSVICTGHCTWRQDDGSGEILAGDKLTLVKDRLCLTGNASIQYGSDQNRTAVTCDTLTAGKDGYEFSGNVKLRHGQ